MIFFLSGEHVILHTSNYRQHNEAVKIVIPIINCSTFQIRSASTKHDYRLFCSVLKKLSLCMTEQQPTITWSSPLFQQVTDLTIQMPMISSSWWHRLLNIGKNIYFV